jgi:hypothetical protein
MKCIDPEKNSIWVKFTINWFRNISYKFDFLNTVIEKIVKEHFRTNINFEAVNFFGIFEKAILASIFLKN